MTDPTPDEGDTVFEFPCEFPIKIMGLATDDFDELVVGIVLNHVDDLVEGAISRRLSRNGKYLSVTVTLIAESKGQLDNIYRELTAHERILMVL